MERIFAVMTAHGPRWDPSAPVDGQADWRAHADFMNALEAANFVLIGGTFVGTPDALLIVRAASEDEARARLAPDPWMERELLRIASVRPWTLRLGEDFAARWVPARARRKAKESQGGRGKKPRKAKVARRQKPRKAKAASAKKPRKAKESQQKPRVFA